MSYYITKIQCLCIAVLLSALALINGAAAETRPNIAVLVSLNIKPYVEAFEGLNRVVSDAGADSDVFFLEKFKGKSRKILKEKIERENFHLFIAIGPEAAHFIWSEFKDSRTPALYTMVLDPEKMPDAPKELCGVSFRLPVSLQIQEISRTLPGLKRMGLLYDPEYNSPFFQVAYESAPGFGVQIIPLAISSRKDIPEVLDKYWNQVDGLWMIPDRTIISESIIQYIIKESLLKKIPVIGYNRFFYESGAALNFIFDYKSLGEQTGKHAVSILNGAPCVEKVPEFDIWLNRRVINKLGIPVMENKGTKP